MRINPCLQAAAEKYVSGGPTILNTQHLTAEALALFLRDRSTMTISKDCLERVCKLGVSPQDARGGNILAVNMKAFLMSLMIHHHPGHIFENVEEGEGQGLKEAADQMLLSFENICFAILQREAEPMVAGFLQNFHHYLFCFMRWKLVNKTSLVSRLELALAALYETMIQVAPHAAVMEELTSQVENLRVKMEEIAGPPALQAFDARGHFPQHFAGRLFLCRQLSRQRMVYEMLLDPSFHLTPCKIQGHSIADLAFWNVMCKDLVSQSPASFQSAKTVLVEILDGLARLESSDAREESLIGAVQQIENCTWKDRIQLLHCIMQVFRAKCNGQALEKNTWLLLEEMDALFHDESHRPFPYFFCDALGLFNDLLKSMNLDWANRRLLEVQEIVAGNNGAEHLAKDFQMQLDNSEITLNLTARWVDQALNCSVLELKLVQKDDLSAMREEAYRAVHAIGMFNLVADEKRKWIEDCPETLCLALSHLTSLHEIIGYQVMLGAAIKTALGLVDAELLVAPIQTLTEGNFKKVLLFARVNLCID